MSNVVRNDENPPSTVILSVGNTEDEPKSNGGEGNIKANPTNSKTNVNKTTEVPVKKESPKVFAFTLLPPVRSGDRPVLAVPKSAETVRLTIVHDNEKEFARYQADVYDQNGDLIWSQEMPVNSARLSNPITISIRNSTLKTGAYELKVSGISDGIQMEESRCLTKPIHQPRRPTAGTRPVSGRSKRNMAHGPLRRDQAYFP